VAAAGALVGEAGGRAAGAGRRFLEAARAQGMDLSRFWCTVDPATDRIRHASVLVPGAGRTGMLFCSSPSRPSDAPEVGAMLDALAEATPGPLLAQALLETGQEPLEHALSMAGFSRVGLLQYLRRPWPQAEAAPAAPGPWPDGVEVRPWKSGDDASLGEALEASYEQTLDCPELHGMRRARDVIESHRSTGRWDPALWWLVFESGRPRGALLLNPCPDHANTELVYLGLAPSLRRRGLARSLLSMGLRALSTRPHRTVACAVDSRNAPARGLYESFGFRLFAERVAFVRALPARTRER
jgi:ribosomal protein S18 acetylase RimI-like enzyme